MVLPVNNPATPVVEGVDVAMTTEPDCEALKAKYDVISGKHGANPKIDGHQSHHIFQNAAVKDSSGTPMISHYSGRAVMLFGGSSTPGSEHAIANSLQTTRFRKDMKSSLPGTTFGDFKKWSRDDLAQAFKEGNSTRDDMTDEEAEMLADCLAAEAEEELQEYRKDNDLPPIKDSDQMTLPKGCFALGTMVWTVSGLRAVESLELGDELLTSAGPLPITRIDGCFNRIVEFELERSGRRLALSTEHRVRLADGRLLRAAHLRAGHVLVDRRGASVTVSAVEPRSRCDWLIGLAVSTRAATFIGDHGVNVELVDAGAPMRGRVDPRALPRFSPALLERHA